ncbi:MAG TPA: rhodanese-like domain-containing protein [Caulobacteraceae bacterium]|nr:rhodanese-like domain-containing protein [Caulobacteraceae bacterium]
MSTLTPLEPKDVARRLKDGSAVLIDIREPEEYRAAHVAEAVSRPLSVFAPHAVEAGKSVIFTCKSGMRTNMNCERLAASVDGDAYVLKGGLDGWAAAGLPVVRGR